MISHHHESRQIRRFNERTKAKAEAADQKADRQAYIQINFLISKVFKGNELEELAYKLGIMERQRELTTLGFISVLMMGCICDTCDDGVRSLRRMCLLLHNDFFGGIHIEPPALAKKINQIETSRFVKEVMSRIMAYKIDRSLKKNLKKFKGKIASLYRILLQDSTVISLPDSLKRIFRGCGGAASEAAVKCDYIIDQSNHILVRVKLVAGRIPDITMSADIIDYIGEGDLVIRDLGYFHLTQLSRISGKDAHFISRLSKSANVYLKKDDQEPVDLIAHLSKLKIDEDIEIYIGKIERLKVRLLGIKVPPEVVEARRKKHKENRKKQEPSEELQEWNGYTLMVTDIPKEALSLKMVLKLYKIRWQIELFFKNIKSNLCVDKLTGKNKYRILCIIYIKIALTWIVANLYAYAQGLVGMAMEVSLDQFTKWLKEEGRLKIAFLTSDISSLLEELERDVYLLCKQKRKRKPTMQDIEATYMKEQNVA